MILPRLHALVIGPGLSQDKFMLECAERILALAVQAKIPIVIDAVILNATDC